MSSVFHQCTFSTVLRGLLLIPVVVSLNACSLFESDEDQMTDARVLAPLEVPPDLVAAVGDPRLARPELPETQVGTKSEATPATPPATTKTADCRCDQPPRIGERVLPAGKGVQRMREGSRRWLVVEAEPEQVWPLVRNFLTMRGYQVSRDEPAIGLLETDWKAQYADEKATDGEANWREGLRVRIEPADQAGHTNIFLSQRNSQRVAGEGEAAARWELRPVNEDRAVEMLNRLARFLAAKNVSDAVPLKPLKAHIGVDSDEHTVIIVEADFEHTWRRTGLALDALGFVIEDHDRANRIFHIYNDLPSGLSEEELKFGKEKSATVREEYWIHVHEAGDTSHISVRNKAGKFDESQVARHLLTLLQAQFQ